MMRVAVDFLPLTVDYREKFAAAGRYPGGFFKREARPSTEEILTMRLVDSVLRPLIPKRLSFRNTGDDPINVSR